ncbi:MAG: glycosyltransferase [Clostridia bacterium]|nr:glycosyltransferase [Clostridia bacterium]
MTRNKKILYAASTASHLRRFHMPYIEALRRENDVRLLADGEGMDFNVPFQKSFFSLSNLKTVKTIRKILKQERFDLIVVHTTLAAFLVRAATVGLKHRPYIKNVVHGYLFSQNDKGLRARILLFCEKLFARRTDEILVMNEEDLYIAKKHKLCRGEVSFIYGMGLSNALPEPKKDAELRALFAAGTDDFLCIFVGELSKRKNQSFLIRATRQLRDSGIPVKLLLLGEGSMREELEELVSELSLEEHVFLPGNVEGVLSHLGIADLYVCSSISEGLPFNILEAMHCGLPILASRVKGQVDLLDEEQLFPLGDMTAFCSAVRRVYESKTVGIQVCNYRRLDSYRLDTVFQTNLTLLSRMNDETN